MNTFRTISQTLLMTVLFVGSVGACDGGQIPSYKSTFAKNLRNALMYNPGLLPIAGAFVMVNCGNNTTSNKIASTLVKTAFLGAARVDSDKRLIPGANIKSMSFFAAADAGIRFVAEKVASIGAIKSALDSVEGAVGKKAMKVMRMGKEVAVGYAAYRLVNEFDLYRTIVSGSSSEEGMTGSSSEISKVADYELL